MPNQTSDRKPRKKSDTKNELDGGIWRLFVQACGGGCCLCPSHGGDSLCRGHLVSRDDEGATDLENLIPLCKSCNGKLKENCAPDCRPLEWRDTFAKLLLASLHLKIRSESLPLSDLRLRTPYTDENKAVLGFESVKFVLDTHYIGPIDAPPQPVSSSQVEALLSDFVARIRAKDENLQPPSAARQQEIRNAIVRMRVPNFLLAAEEYIRQAQWQRDDGTIVSDGWTAIGGLALSYLPEALARRVRLAAQEKSERAQRQKAEEQAKIWRQERIQADYMEAIGMPAYPGMPAADLEFQESAAIVNEELGERSLGVLRRGKLHKHDELMAEKLKRHLRLKQCRKWVLAMGLNKEGQQEYAKTIRRISDWIDCARTIEELDASCDLDSLYYALDPENPPASEFLF